jgi:hypothetical protein
MFLHPLLLSPSQQLSICSSGNCTGLSSCYLTKQQESCRRNFGPYGGMRQWRHCTNVYLCGCILTLSTEKRYAVDKATSSSVAKLERQCRPRTALLRQIRQVNFEADVWRTQCACGFPTWRMSWAESVARMVENRNSYTVLGRKP